MNVTYGELLVDVQNVSVSYGDVSVLNGIDFKIFNTIGHGQVVAILGRSGVGKTQLFRCISGLQVPTSGGVYIDSHAEPVREGEVGVVAQDYPLIETRTVADNLIRAYAISNGRGKEKDGREMAMKYLDDFGLQFIAKHLPSEISGGQRQRIAIIQQMMCSRHYLIMDEPFSGLDIVSKDDAAALIVGMSNQHELNTVILTTHDVRTACAVADRVIVIGRDRDGEGKIVPGSHVFFDLDLKAEDLCWNPEIHKTEKFKNFVENIEDQIRVL